MAKATAQTVPAKPLFDWFKADRSRRPAFVKATGYSDGRVTNWKERGLPRAEVGRVAQFMGLTYEQYLAAAGEKVSVAKQPAAPPYHQLSEESLEIARAFDQLQPQARDYIREQVFIYTVIDKAFPWLRHGKPIGTSYQDFERWHQNNITVKQTLELQRKEKQK